MKEFIQKIRCKQNLDSHEIRNVMQCIMSGLAEKGGVADFLLALNDKGATVEEITGAAKILRAFVWRLRRSMKLVLDTCGTGGIS